jgi:tRNA G37 N-methylase TrmD
VAEWRLKAALAKTLARRPEMLAAAELGPEARAALLALNQPGDPPPLPTRTPPARR